MRTWLIVIVMALCCPGIVQAQTANCTVSGYLFKADGSPAALAQVHVISVIRSGPSYVLTPGVLTTDATGFTSFTAPRHSTIWIVATALGLTASGDVAILIPDADSATLDVLAQGARPPVSGFNLTSGSNPTLGLRLQDFGISLNVDPTPPPTTVESSSGRSGSVALTSGDISAGLKVTRLGSRPLVGVVADGADTSVSSLTFVKPDNTTPTTPITFETNEKGAGNFYIGMGSSPNPFGVRRDQVLTWGYNQVAGAGNRVLTTEHALAYRIENYWTPNAGTQATESHLVYINRAGVSKRVQSLYIDLNTDAVVNDVTSDYSSWTTSAGVVNFLLTPGLVRLLNRTQLMSDTNNYPFLRQKKNGTANAFGTLIYMNGADRVVLGGQGTLGLQIDGASVTPAITGTRFLCISTQGVITSSVTPCSGT